MQETGRVFFMARMTPFQMSPRGQNGNTREQSGRLETTAPPFIGVLAVSSFCLPVDAYVCVCGGAGQLAPFLTVPQWSTRV